MKNFSLSFIEPKAVTLSSYTNNTEISLRQVAFPAAKSVFDAKLIIFNLRQERRRFEPTLQLDDADDADVRSRKGFDRRSDMSQSKEACLDFDGWSVWKRIPIRNFGNYETILIRLPGHSLNDLSIVRSLSLFAKTSISWEQIVTDRFPSTGSTNWAHIWHLDISL